MRSPRAPMNRFARYVLRLHLVPLVIGFGIITFIFSLDFLFEYVDLLVTKGVPPLVVGKLFLLGQGWMIALSVPCAVLIATLIVPYLIWNRRQEVAR